jgi:hypothetical protein
MDILEKLEDLLYCSKLEKIKTDPKYIKYINNPSEEMQLEAVKRDGYSIGYINNPSEEVQLEAVRQQGNSICFITNPSIEIQKEAIKNSPEYAIFHITDPTEEIKLEAIKTNPHVIINIIQNNFKKFNINEEFIMKAIDISGYDFNLITDLDLSKLSGENLETIYNNIIIKDIIE